MKESFELCADQDCYTIILKRNSALAKKILSILFGEPYIDKESSNSYQSFSETSLSNDTSDEKKLTDKTSPSASVSWPFEISPEQIEKDKLLKGEYEWILLYGFILSISGKDFFNKTELKQLYRETNRLNQSNYKSFSTNIKKCIAKGYLTMNEEDELLHLTEEGKRLISSIVSLNARDILVYCKLKKSFKFMYWVILLTSLNLYVILVSYKGGVHYDKRKDYSRKKTTRKKCSLSSYYNL